MVSILYDSKTDYGTFENIKNFKSITDMNDFIRLENLKQDEYIIIEEQTELRGN